MTGYKIHLYAEKFVSDYTDLVGRYQLLLDQSASAEEDFWLMMQFGAEFLKSIEGNRYEWYEFLTDCNAMMAMPSSVHKQVITILFDFKHIHWLSPQVPIFVGPFDVGINAMMLEKEDTIENYIKPILFAGGIEEC